MKKNTIKLAVAGAVLAAASVANAGIIIPAGDWTVDINGNVNAFYIHNRSSDSNTVQGGLANTKAASTKTSGENASSINTGLLPSWLAVTGKTRQNDLDVEFAISFQPGASTRTSLAGGGGTENRQAYISFGDKSWGTVLIGKNLGQFGRDAILNDQTLLGVGSQGIVGTAGGTTTTLGGIGSGYIYADFQGQINYTTPNISGFEATVGIVQPIGTLNLSTASASASGNQKAPAYEGVIRYSFAANDVTGKIWAEAKSQNVDNIGSTAAVAGVAGSSTANYVAAVTAVTGQRKSASMYGIGANVNFAGLGLTGYYYSGEGVGTTAFLMDGFDSAGNRRDSDGGYVQAMYALPTKTKVGISYALSNLDKTGAEAAGTTVAENERVTVGAYHPLTKHLNLVAEYNRIESENQVNAKNKSDIISAGAILFF